MDLSSVDQDDIFQLQPNSSFLRYRIEQSFPSIIAKAPQMAVPQAFSIPEWLLRPVRDLAQLNPPIAPSSALMAADWPDRPADREFEPLAALVHFLLQHLPQVAEPDRQGAALRLSRLFDGQIDNETICSLVDEVMKLLGDFRFKHLFGAQSSAEVEITGHLVQAGSTRQVQGRIDRLAILDDRILVADYKTARHVPSHIDEIPPSQLTQLAIYSTLLATIIPDKPIHASLIYTSGPTVFELKWTQLDKALELLVKPAKNFA
jgi:ATP-dependent helicase/nuclease subunit A